MNFQFTKYGLVNALWSLIPIFPTWTLFPGIISALLIENAINDCETSYLIVLLGSIILTIAITIFLLFRLDKQTKMSFSLWCLSIYTLINTAGLISIVGIHSACYGDGQTLLACIYSGPIASLSVIALGFLSDLKVKIASTKKWE